MNNFQLQRHPENPILGPGSMPGADAVFNCGQTTYQGKTILLVATSGVIGTIRLPSPLDKVVAVLYSKRTNERTPCSADFPGGVPLAGAGERRKAGVG